MPAAARKGDSLATGHGCSGTTTIASVQPSKTFINNILSSVKGDVSAVHTIPNPPACVPHTSTIIGGSSSVFIESIAGARIGDAYEGGAVISGSPNTFHGG